MDKLRIENLCKEYRGFALKGVSFSVPCGAVVGLIGENGAGKSTVINSVLGIVRPDSGRILFDGIQTDKLSLRQRQKIAFVLDEGCLPEELNMSMLNKVMGMMYDTWNAKKFSGLLSKFSLPADKLYKDFSKGMKMKAAIAVALSYDSQLLILDEPTGGLDPVVRDEILGMLYDYNAQGERSVLISSHITADLEKLCDYIVYLHRGEVVLSEEKDELLRRYAVYSLDEGQVKELDGDAVVRVLRREYATDVLALRDKMPSDFECRQATLDDIMLFYSKGE